MKQGVLKFSISFFPERRKGKDNRVILENVPIRVSVAYKGNRVMTSTGHRIDATKWVEKKQRVKSSGNPKELQAANSINAHLADIESRITRLFKRHEENDVMPSKTLILEAITPQPQDKTLEGVYDAFSEYIRVKGKANSWTPNSYKKHKTMLNRLHEFNPRLKLQDFNLDVMQAFIYWMQHKKKKTLRNTTIAKDIQCVFYFLKWATRKGIYKNPDVLQYKPKLRGTDGKNRAIVYLTWDELMTLFNYPFKRETQKNIRDVFCFQCFTGLRYGDVYNLKKTDIQPDKIIFTTLKTAETLSIELNKYSREILDRHKEKIYPDGKALPVISNQKFNKYLKEVCAKAEINAPMTMVYYIGAKRYETTKPKHKLIGTHAGRRTFITNGLALGIPTEVIMKWTGHKSYSIMKPYLAISDQLKEKEMDKWNQPE